MLVDFIRQIRASKDFKLGDDFEFLEFDDISQPSEEEGGSPVPEQVEIWAAVKIPYEGNLPESYKVLNLIIGDWVSENEDSLTEVIHESLKEYITENYPDSEVSGMDEGDSAIWHDQLDYMPRVDEKEKYFIVEIELVLHAEPIED